LQNPTARYQLSGHIEEVSCKVRAIQLIVAVIKSVIGHDVYGHGSISMVQVDWFAFCEQGFHSLDQLSSFCLNDIFESQDCFSREDRVDSSTTHSMKSIVCGAERSCLQPKRIVEICCFGRCRRAYLIHLLIIIGITEMDFVRGYSNHRSVFLVEFFNLEVELASPAEEVVLDDVVMCDEAQNGPGILASG
jgi:hypothetical protein